MLKEDGGSEVVWMKGTVFWGNETGLKYGLDVRGVGLSIKAVSSVMHSPSPSPPFSCFTAGFKGIEGRVNKRKRISHGD